MKLNKKILGFILTGILTVGMVGCSEELNTAQYLTEQGQQVIASYKKDKADYKELKELNDYTEKGLVKLDVVVKDIELNEQNLEIDIDYDKLDIVFNTTNPVKIIQPSFTVDKEISVGDTITLYGRYNGIVKQVIGDKVFYFHMITTHFIES